MRIRVLLHGFCVVAYFACWMVVAAGSVCSADGDPTPEKAPPGAHATPYQGGPWHGLGESIGGEGISGPPAAAIRTKQLRKHLEASKEELRRRDAGLDPNWQITTEGLREAVRHDEALLKALEAAGNRSGFPARLHPANSAAGATQSESVRVVPLSDRLDEFDAVVLGTKVKLEAVEEKGDGAVEYYGVLHVKLQEVIKGGKIEAGQTIRVRIPYLEQVARPPNVPGKTLWTSPRKAAIEAVGASHMEPQLRRGLFGLEASPADAAERYRLLWFNVLPDGEDWEPYLEQFRKKARPLRRS